MPSKTAQPKKAPPPNVNVAADLPKDPGDLYTRCLASWNAIKADTAHFPTPTPAATVVDPVLAALSSSIQAAEGGTPAEKAAVRTAVRNVHTVWSQVRPYVQGVLRTLPIADVPTILANIGMYASNTGKRPPKPPLAVKDAAVSGSARAEALAVADAVTYQWDWSVDQTTWSTMTTAKCYAVISGLTPGKLYYIRVRAFLRDETTTNVIATIPFIAR